MKTAIIDTRASADAERELLRRGFAVLRTPPSKNLPTALASHPDMLFSVIGDTLITSADYVEEAPMLFDDLRHSTDLKFAFTADLFGRDYPSDCIFNVLVMGNRLFCKSDTVSREVVKLAERRGLKITEVRQGYPACTVLPLGENAAITADRGMAAAMASEGIRVTLIENGDIALPPYEYGFIGGAAGVFDDVVYFLGDPMRHRCSDKIISAVRAEGLGFVALSDAPLSDLGRIVFAE